MRTDLSVFTLRAKYHKLKYGTELNQGEIKPPSYDSGKKNLSFSLLLINCHSPVVRCWRSPADFLMIVPSCWLKYVMRLSGCLQSDSKSSVARHLHQIRELCRVRTCTVRGLLHCGRPNGSNLVKKSCLQYCDVSR